MELGVPEEIAWYAKKNHGWWKLGNIPPVKWALSNEWFEKQGLISLEKRWLKAKGLLETAVCENARTVV